MAVLFTLTLIMHCDLSYFKIALLACEFPYSQQSIVTHVVVVPDNLLYHLLWYSQSYREQPLLEDPAPDALFADVKMLFVPTHTVKGFSLNGSQIGSLNVTSAQIISQDLFVALFYFTDVICILPPLCSTSKLARTSPPMSQNATAPIILLYLW